MFPFHDRFKDGIAASPASEADITEEQKRVVSSEI